MICFSIVFKNLCIKSHEHEIDIFAADKSANWTVVFNSDSTAKKMNDSWLGIVKKIQEFLGDQDQTLRGCKGRKELYLGGTSTFTGAPTLRLIDEYGNVIENFSTKHNPDKTYLKISYLQDYCISSFKKQVGAKVSEHSTSYPPERETVEYSMSMADLLKASNESSFSKTSRCLLMLEKVGTNDTDAFVKTIDAAAAQDRKKAIERYRERFTSKCVPNNLIGDIADALWMDPYLFTCVTIKDQGDGPKKILRIFTFDTAYTVYAKKLKQDLVDLLPVRLDHSQQRINNCRRGWQLAKCLSLSPADDKVLGKLEKTVMAHEEQLTAEDLRLAKEKFAVIQAQCRCSEVEHQRIVSKGLESQRKRGEAAEKALALERQRAQEAERTMNLERARAQELERKHRRQMLGIAAGTTAVLTTGFAAYHYLWKPSGQAHVQSVTK